MGDRDLGVTETYPDSFLIQNGGRIYNVKSPPTSKRMPAKGNGVDDDTHALQDAWQFLKDEFAAHDNDNYPGGYIVYLPAGTYLVSDTIIYPGASLEATHRRRLDRRGPCPLRRREPVGRRADS